MPNHLKNEFSPYLLQHATNPVEWYPWGEAALTKARHENKPIFLSIGYAACHWCHVMERESFQDLSTAKILNEHFVSIKVDREQRPDLDSLYMRATTALTGSGGWPMSVFLTPDLRPFYAGTYFPPVRRYNIPAFKEVLSGVARAWSERPADIESVAVQVLNQIGFASESGKDIPLTLKNLEDITRQLVESSDKEFGGWGAAPKFPQPMVIEFLLRQAETSPGALDGAVHTLEAMSRGGMYDIVGGGFSRYSTDNMWRVPHFEKMLYDNAQLATAYLHAWQITGSASFKQIVVETLDFVLREMTHPEGGFYSSLDADSEGVEGKYYVWTAEQLRATLGEENLYELFAAAYDITPNGNWDGATVLQRALDNAALAIRFNVDPEQIARQISDCHVRLLQARSVRIRPKTDDKILTSWNGLMLQAFCQASRFLDEESLRLRYGTAAAKNVNFLWDCYRPAGQLRRMWRNGNASREVFLEDFASLILALLEMYQLSFDNRWFQWSIELGEEMIVRYSDPDGGFFDTASDGEVLPIRPKDLQDNAIPSGNALACEALLKLAAFTGDRRFQELGERALALVSQDAHRYPTAFARWLNATHFSLSGRKQLALLYPREVSVQPFLEIIRSGYRPNMVVAASEFPPDDDAPSLLANRNLFNNKATAYVCENFVCMLPVSTPEELSKQL